MNGNIIIQLWSLTLDQKSELYLYAFYVLTLYINIYIYIYILDILYTVRVNFQRRKLTWVHDKWSIFNVENRPLIKTNANAKLWSQRVE